MGDDKKGMDNALLYWLHAVTPLHVGSGRGTGFIDLPIMREKATGWPLIPGSTVKGVWRAYAEQHIDDRNLIAAAFGRSADQGNEHAGSLAITDAHIVLLPVRSLYGTFAYVTSPLVLSRLRREIQVVGVSNAPTAPVDVESGEAMIGNESVIANGERMFLEDLDFRVQANATVDQWGEWLGSTLFPAPADAQVRALFRQRIAIVDDGSFSYLTKQGTEVNARVRIDSNTKTVADGALWYEESLPAESVLAGIAWCERVFSGAYTPDALLQTILHQPIVNQIGGKASTGKGLVRTVFTGKEG